jgi:hypothetical protein
MSRRIENWYPTVGAVAVALFVVVYCRWQSGWIPPKATSDVLSAVINVSAIAVGFLAAAKSILFTIEHTRIIRLLKSANRLREVVRYMMRAINVSFALAGVSTAALLADADAHHWYTSPLAVVWSFLLAASALTYYRVIRIFSIILEASDGKQTVTPLPDPPETSLTPS